MCLLDSGCRPLVGASSWAYIPSTPAWARALVLNAARAWNLAQVWFQQNYYPDGGVYSFVASPLGNVTVSFGMPAEFASIAVGWTQYVLEGASTIVSSGFAVAEGGSFGGVWWDFSRRRVG